MAFEQPPRAYDDRYVNHLAVERPGGTTRGRVNGVFLHNPGRIRDLVVRRRVLIVHNGYLARVNASGAHETEPARPPDHLRKRRSIAKRRDAVDETERHDAGRARGKDHLLFRHEERVFT